MRGWFPWPNWSRRTVIPRSCPAGFRQRHVQGCRQCGGGKIGVWSRKDLQLVRELFMRERKQVFRVLDAMQNAYCRSDERRARFVSLCHDVDVQKLTSEAYMNKKPVKARPMAHLNIGIKNLAQLARLVSPLRT